MRAGSWHHVAEAVLLALLVLPLVASCIGVILPAAGFFPALGGTRLSWQPMHDALATPGLATSVTLTLATALATTALALAGSFAVLATFRGSRAGRWIGRACGPIIAVPPSAVAIGVLFLLAPSGWLLRLVSPWLTGFDRPPAFALVPDPHGAALVFALLSKEVPFLLLVSLAALSTLPARRLLDTGRSLGYGPAASWIYLVLPLVYRRIRLPLAAVMIFALSVIDMPRLLALPPRSPSSRSRGSSMRSSRRLPAAFLACLQIGVTLLALLVWRGGEIIAGVVLSMARRRALRIRKAGTVMAPVALIGLVPPAAAVAGLVAAAIWSLAASWFFPAALPTAYSLRAWGRIDTLLPALAGSLGLAVAASVLATGIVLLMVSLNRRRPRPLLRIAIYAPLLIPQVSLVLGLQAVLVWLWLDGTWLAMLWIHALFICPFAWLIIAPAEAAMDRRYIAVAASLGAGPGRSYLQVVLPMLAPAVITALFVGVSVSVALYLPSLFAGGGRITTITLEAVALASGGSRQMAGVAAMLLAIRSSSSSFCAFGSTADTAISRACGPAGSIRYPLDLRRAGIQRTLPHRQQRTAGGSGAHSRLRRLQQLGLSG